MSPSCDFDRFLREDELDEWLGALVATVALFQATDQRSTPPMPY